MKLFRTFIVIAVFSVCRTRRRSGGRANAAGIVGSIQRSGPLVDSLWQYGASACGSDGGVQDRPAPRLSAGSVEHRQRRAAGFIRRIGASADANLCLGKSQLCVPSGRQSSDARYGSAQHQQRFDLWLDRRAVAVAAFWKGKDVRMGARLADAERAERCAAGVECRVERRRDCAVQ